MKTAILFSAAIGICLLDWPISTAARIVEHWPYDKLFKHADLVVFAEPVETKPTGDPPPTHTWAYEFVGQETRFKVMHCLKGKTEGGKIQVLHFKFGDFKKGIDPKSIDAVLLVDAPGLVAFRSKAVIVTAGKETHVLKTPEYLLFLKRSKDGRYEPVSGQIDPADSVREMLPGRADVLNNKN